MSMALFRSRRSPDDAAAERIAADLDRDVFNLIPPRLEEPERPAFERPYGLHRPVDLDVAALEAVRAQREAELAATAFVATTLESERSAAPDVIALTPDATPTPASAAPISPAPDLRAADRIAAGPALAAGKAAAGGVDFSRLSIDNSGQLYWDGKPVEVQRRVALSRRQTLVATACAAMLFVVALAASLQVAAAARDLGCRTGWTVCSGVPT